MLGKFIVVEGLEGAGKSTVLTALEALLQERGINVIRTREPGGTPFAEHLREAVKQNWAEIVSDATELLLMYAARAQLVENVIFPSLSQGHWVLADRHDWSSIAYQGGGRQCDMNHLKALQALTLKGLTADFTLYLDVEPKIGLRRAAGRGELDRIEQSSLAFFNRARETYLSLAQTHHGSCAVIDANQDALTVKEASVLALTGYLEQQL